MPTFNLKPTDRRIKAYYDELQRLERLGATNETAVRLPFQTLLEYCGRQSDLTLRLEYPMKGRGGNQLFIDAALFDEYNLLHGYCESKDTHDDLPTEVRRKLEHGYPRNNIIFQTPEHAILLQNDWQLDADLTDPTQLVDVLQAFFDYRPRAYDEWEEAVAQFKDRVPEIGNSLAGIIKEARKTNPQFTVAFNDFHEKCCQALNPNLSKAAVQEMLIQHLLTVRLFRTVFSHSDFTRRNVIAREIENVIDALTSHAFSREVFLRKLDRFYIAIERAAEMMTDYAQKQGFLNTVYEQFFQGFSVKVADTHGIVYTPQPIVNFIVNSVAEILKTEFEGRSLSDSGVHILDPFVGTGNFLVRIMQEIDKTALADKYARELHCNEVMLLPYYVASMNIEHQFYEATGTYQPFEGICLVDSFETAEEQQFLLFEPENSERVKGQKDTDMFVIIGNPPYNVGQVNENDNNKNRKYKTVDKWIADTYVKDSKATLRSKLYDPYVKAILWGLNRIGDEGIVAFITNNGFLDGVAFDGMRKHLADECDAIYILDLGGNARRGLKVSDANVFGIRVGVSINLFVKTRGNPSEQARIFYHRVDEGWNKRQKFDFLKEREHIGNIAWQTVQPDTRYTWLTEGLHAEFEDFIPIGTKEAKAEKSGGGAVIFSLYSLGGTTNRDVLAYSFDLELLQERVRTFIEIYNSTVDRKRRHDPDDPIENFIDTNDPRIKWTRQVKTSLKKLELSNYEDSHFRTALYRPFTQKYLYFDHFWNEARYQQYRIFPTPETETENRVICMTGKGSEKPFMALMSQQLTDLHVVGPGCGAQCFPFYIYSEDGTNRRENITDWALAQYRAYYRDDTIGKWDIFHYVYALLHHPDYRKRYQANLKRDLPRLPYTPDFWGFAKAGQRLGEIHVYYEEAEEYPLRFIETPDTPLNWRVEKMKLSKDKTQLLYNEFLTLDGIPGKALKYQLGSRSALGWVIDQYCVKTDRRSGIVNDPNREDDPQYIVKLIKKVVTVSLETVEIVEGLPGLGIFSDKSPS